jgi:TRAP-type C4-dicarboxylate transport system permease small subunit
MKALSRGIDWLENVVISVAIFTSIAISGVGVFFRYVVGSSLSWVEESAGFFLLIVIVIGIGAAVKKGAHLRVDIIHHFFPKTKIPLDILADVFALGVMTLLFFLAVNFFLDMLARGQTSTSITWLPMAVPILFMPLGYLTAIFRLIEHLRNYLKNRDGAPAENVLPKVEDKA